MRWGAIKGAALNMRLTVVPDKRSANAKIMFVKDPSIENINLIGMGTQQISESNITHTILIGDDAQEKIEVLILHFSRGNVL